MLREGWSRRKETWLIALCLCLGMGASFCPGWLAMSHLKLMAAQCDVVHSVPLKHIARYFDIFLQLWRSLLMEIERCYEILLNSNFRFLLWTEIVTVIYCFPVPFMGFVCLYAVLAVSMLAEMKTVHLTAWCARPAFSEELGAPPITLSWGFLCPSDCS